MDANRKRRLIAKGIRFEGESEEKQRLFGDEGGPVAFFRWFFFRLMDFDTEEYKRQFWSEARKTGRSIGRQPTTVGDYLDPAKNPNYLWSVHLDIILAALGVSLFLWIVARILRAHIKVLRRPTYYKVEREKRRALAEERRRIRRRRTANPQPTATQLEAAFESARDSAENMIRFGSLLEDLECYVDNSIVWDGESGRIVGRKGGIRKWLEKHSPSLARRYKTVMRYKALSKQFRQATGVKDPVPATAILPANGKQGAETKGTRASHTAAPDKTSYRIRETRAKVMPCDEYAGGLREAKRIAAEILSKCKGTVESLATELALMLSEDLIVAKKRSLLERLTERL